MLNRKYENLMQLLMLEEHPITASALSSKMNVSTRSIKTYVHDINGLYPNCIYANKEGYRINKKLGSQLLDNNPYTVPQTSKERVIYSIHRLIQHPIDAYELCDTLFISLSTLKNVLSKVRRKLQEYDLVLHNKNDILSIEGLETNKRKLLSSMLYKESNVNFVNLDAIQNSFKDIDIFYIKDVITDTFNTHYYFINDYSLVNLILHITIAIDRIKNNSNATIEEPTYAMAKEEHILAQAVCQKLEKRFDIKFSSNEISELAILLISRATSLNYQEMHKDNLYELIDTDVMQLVQTLVESVNTWYYINLNEPEFLIRFALHIKNLLIRSKHSRFSKNPLVQEIKSGCPLIYDVAVHLSSIIKKERGVTINDDEIAYIAFHIGSTLEAQKDLHNKITAIFCCPNYYNMNTTLIDSLNSHFSNQMLIKNIVNTVEEIEKENSDIIISTIPSNNHVPQHFIQIGIFLNQTDIYAIEEKIKTIKQRKQKNQFRNYLQEMLSEQLFEANRYLRTREEVIPYMCDTLEKYEYVNHTFITQLIEREEMSSTAYGAFAIPHAMKMNANKTGIYILLSKKPITWGEHQVSIVLMMCFNASKRHLFNQVFEPITMILSNPENINIISKCNDYHTFIDTLVNCLQV